MACCFSYRNLRLTLGITLPRQFSLPCTPFDFTMSRHLWLKFMVAFGSWFHYYRLYGAKVGLFCWPRFYYGALGLKPVRHVKAAPFWTGDSILALLFDCRELILASQLYSQLSQVGLYETLPPDLKNFPRTFVARPIYSLCTVVRPSVKTSGSGYQDVAGCFSPT